ncbi:MAG: UbiA family prenyltransferase [Bdellovibrionota bacterium]
MTFILRYRILEIFQCLWISLSALLFVEAFPPIPKLLIWISSLFLATGSAFWLNDYFDFQSDLQNPRKVRHPSARNLKILAFASLGLSLVLAMTLSFRFFTTIAIISIASALYSSPWLHLKSRLFFPAGIHFLLGIVYFRSIESLAPFAHSETALVLSIFWALLLSVGSLGNELVDKKADAEASLETVATKYQTLSFWLIVSFEILALILLAYISFHENQFVSAGTIVVLGIYFISCIGKNHLTFESEKFRQFYRIVFIAMIIVFCSERALMFLGAP